MINSAISRNICRPERWGPHRGRRQLQAQKLPTQHKSSPTLLNLAIHRPSQRETVCQPRTRHGIQMGAECDRGCPIPHGGGRSNSRHNIHPQRRYPPSCRCGQWKGNIIFLETNDRSVRESRYYGVRGGEIKAGQVAARLLTRETLYSSIKRKRKKRAE